MIFSSFSFLIFFVVVLMLLVLVDSFKFNNAHKVKHGILLCASYFFYGWADWRFCFLMLGLTVIAYLAAKKMHGKNARVWLKLGIVVPLFILGIFKYFNFFVGSISAVLGINSVGALNIILPVGISFYTFQSMSYTIDVYREKVKAASLIEVALYIAFFPQLVAGPIVKAQDFLPQLKNEQSVTLRNLEVGLQIFIMGMFKKVVLADRLSVFVDDVYRTPVAFSSETVWLGVFAYSLQIYFDFSGYSDMAIGCARCMGYELNRNFNLPYIAKNPTEFWKRWHISLSTWLQEYLYISLGGNRRGEVRTYINLMLTMLLGGLWHGANWTFVAWGCLHGIGLCVHKLYVKYFSARNLLPKFFCIVFNTVFVSLVWVFFRANDFESAMQIFTKLFIWSVGVQQIYMWLIFALVVECIYLFWCKYKSARVEVLDSKFKMNAFYIMQDLNSFYGLTAFFFLIMMTLGLAYTNASPFIYFQF